MRETGYQIFADIRNLCCTPIFEVIDGGAQNFFSNGQRSVFIEFDVHCAFDLHLWRSGDNLCMKVLRQGNQRLHNTLNIDYHRFNGSGQNSKLLLQEVACGGYTLTHQDFIGSAANTGEIDSIGTGGSGIVDNFGVLRSGDKHLTESWLVTMYDHIHHVFLEYTQIRLSQNRSRCSKENIRNIGGNHTAAPAIGKGCAHGVLQNMFVILVIANMGAMQGFDHFSIYATRDDFLLSPDLLASGRRTDHRGNFTLLLSELCDIKISQVISDVFRAASVDRDVVMCGNRSQFGDVPNRVAFGFAIRNRFEGKPHINRRATDPGLTIFRQPTGTHAAEFTAHPRAADVAGNHIIRTGERGSNSDFFGTNEHLLRGWIAGEFFGRSLLSGHRLLSFIHFGCGFHPRTGK